MNKSDSERIITVLENIGYQPTSKINEADLILVNMCSVRQSAVDRVYGLFPKFKKLKERNQKLKTILTGCILKEDKKKFKKRPAPHCAEGSSAGFDLILNIKDLPNWPKILKKIKEKTNTISLPWQKYYVSCDYLKVVPKYQTNSKAFIPISNGCNFNCAYCVIPLTRGRLVCRDHNEILKEVENAVKQGFEEIWLLGQNVNSYRVQRETDAKFTLPNFQKKLGRASAKLTRNKKEINFAKLVKMVNAIPGDFKILFTSPHPKNFSAELIDILAKCEKFGKYLNLPVQSGNDEILKKMNRNYTVKEYKNLVKKIRKKIPEIRLSTDVIVGFPGESKEQFENTVKLFKEIKFNIAYIAKYSPRPGTTALQLKDNVPLAEKKRREKILGEIINNK